MKVEDRVKKIGILFLLFVNLVLQIFLVYSQVTGDYRDFKETLHLDFDINGRFVDVKDKGQKIIVEFAFPGAELTLNGHVFNNIETKTFSGFTPQIVLDKIGNILEARFKVNIKGGIYTIEGNEFYAPPGSEVIYDINKKREIHLLIPSGSHLKQFPRMKEDKDIAVRITGSNIQLPEDNELNAGTLSFKNNKVFIDRSAVDEFGLTTINGVVVKYKTSKINENDRLSVYFDLESHKGESDFINFGKGKLSANIKYQDINLQFNKLNHYLTIDDNDFVVFELRRESELNLENRNHRGLIPLLTTKGYIDINNDNFEVRRLGDRILISSAMYYPNTRFTTSSPFEIISLDGRGKPLLGGENILTGEEFKGHRMLIDNFNRIAIVPEDETDFIAKSKGIDSRFSRRIGWNYINEKELENVIGKKIYFDEKIPKGEKQEILGKLRDYWKTLTSEQRESINGINIHRELPYLNRKLLDIEGRTDAGAYASSLSKNIVFRTDSFDYEIFRHESAHLLYHNLFFKDFESKWKKISGEYNKVEIIKGVNYYKDSENPVAPRHGYVMPYGGTQVSEDVATFVQKAYDSEFFKPLLSKDNPWRNIYREKLRLLREYRFLSDREYTAILRGAGEIK